MSSDNEKSDIETFNEFVQTGNQKIIDIQFLYYCCKPYATLDTIRYMVENGADPRAHNDDPFVIACAKRDTNIMLYFLEQCNADINAREGGALFNALGNNRDDIIKLLLENGIRVSDSNIINMISMYPNGIKLLVDSGIDKERIFNILLKLKFNNGNTMHIETLKYLSDIDTDFNQVIRQFVNKQN